ncbi:MAG: PilN domain-containing protein [Candidatus Electronema sp. V4]|uniref:PilN domain-containing protein n=1 Tax=Candidatus Electronema sp. V4 TaxID=3454756 RepID=UPI0040559507
MLRINLLPVKEIKQRAAAKNQLAVFGLVFAGLLVILILAVLMLNGQISSLKTEVADLEQRKSALAKILQEIEELKKKKDEVDKQTALIENLEKSSALTAHLLNEVANLTPNERLWLTSLNQAGASMNLSGMALDNQTVAEFLEKLKGSKYISSVTLANSSLSVYAGRNLKSFTLSCAVAMPESEKKEAGAEAAAQVK